MDHSDRTTSGASGADDVKNTAEQMKQEARRAGQRAETHAKDAAHAAKDAAAGEAERAKDKATGSFGQTASALRDAAGQVEDGSVQERLLSEAAHGLGEIASRVEDRSVSDLARSLSDFGRTNPLAFLGGAALAGFAMSRFARAGTPEKSGSETDIPAPAAAPAGVRGQGSN